MLRLVERQSLSTQHEVSLGLSAGTDLVLELKGSEALVVEHLADVSSVEVEVSMAEVHESDSSDEEDEPGVVALTLSVKGIVTELVTVGKVMDVVLLFPSVAATVG